MGFWRVAVTVAAAVAILFAMVGFGHLLPWHRTAPSKDGSDVHAGSGDARGGLPMREPGLDKQDGQAVFACPDCVTDGGSKWPDESDDEDDDGDDGWGKGKGKAKGHGKGNR